MCRRWGRLDINTGRWQAWLYCVLEGKRGVKVFTPGVCSLIGEHAGSDTTRGCWMSLHNRWNTFIYSYTLSVPIVCYSMCAYIMCAIVSGIIHWNKFISLLAILTFCSCLLAVLDYCLLASSFLQRATVSFRSGTVLFRPLNFSKHTQILFGQSLNHYPKLFKRGIQCRKYRI